MRPARATARHARHGPEMRLMFLFPCQVALNSSTLVDVKVMDVFSVVSISRIERRIFLKSRQLDGERLGLAAWLLSASTPFCAACCVFPRPSRVLEAEMLNPILWSPQEFVSFIANCYNPVSGDSIPSYTKNGICCGVGMQCGSQPPEPANSASRPRTTLAQPEQHHETKISSRSRRICCSRTSSGVIRFRASSPFLTRAAV